MDLDAAPCAAGRGLLALPWGNPFEAGKSESRFTLVFYTPCSSPEAALGGSKEMRRIGYCNVVMRKIPTPRARGTREMGQRFRSVKLDARLEKCLAWRRGSQNSGCVVDGFQLRIREDERECSCGCACRQIARTDISVSASWAGVERLPGFVREGHSAGEAIERHRN